MCMCVCMCVCACFNSPLWCSTSWDLRSRVRTSSLFSASSSSLAFWSSLWKCKHIISMHLKIYIAPRRGTILPDKLTKIFEVPFRTFLNFVRRAFTFHMFCAKPFTCWHSNLDWEKSDSFFLSRTHFSSLSARKVNGGEFIYNSSTVQRQFYWGSMFYQTYRS